MLFNVLSCVAAALLAIPLVVFSVKIIKQVRPKPLEPSEVISRARKEMRIDLFAFSGFLLVGIMIVAVRFYQQHRYIKQLECCLSDKVAECQEKDRVLGVRQSVLGGTVANKEKDE